MKKKSIIYEYVVKHEDGTVSEQKPWNFKIKPDMFSILQMHDEEGNFLRFRYVKTVFYVGEDADYALIHFVPAKEIENSSNDSKR